VKGLETNLVEAILIGGTLLAVAQLLDTAVSVNRRRQPDFDAATVAAQIDHRGFRPVGAAKEQLGRRHRPGKAVVTGRQRPDSAVAAEKASDGTGGSPGSRPDSRPGTSTAGSEVTHHSPWLQPTRSGRPPLSTAPPANQGLLARRPAARATHRTAG
jgi:hypothetical protein